MPPPPKGKAPPLPPQPRHHAVVNIEEAYTHAHELLGHWVACHGIEHAPAFSGGILDSWPAEAVDAWPIFSAEAAAVTEYARYKEERR